ncbi:MAG: tRNA (uridine(34)/cytosine(34)/5-carboxymethylaminomethyluridine(34)-2'-O)-methyltransferase TrmL [Bdellovibrionales bacterium GWA2_49_15]|nr:MAG: tRNA (uridine(34)/cytosine(34)/5-carboxymethylaminomethyluridine(34)-2'-O)-methyltransferase TrmL [Bdellovibrionales bacterium GWA2_49_15]HAZ11927.1 tRNA (uridine(34)/cytosine(34)/5-carboxymethylaminomethyluridine(34)-2'-O)-methyltransferase TrmL [Bdellovibrionales bacterium]
MFSRPAIVLVAPEIPGNTGTIGRTCVGLDFDLVLIRPLGFDISEKEVRRAGLDYWKYVRCHIFESFEEFLLQTKPDPANLFFFSKRAEKTYFHAPFTANSVLIFGSETKGLPESILSSYQNQTYSLPMYSDKIRSLNLANAATAVAYEVVRQMHF